MKARTTLEVPYDVHGNLMHYPYGEVEWRIAEKLVRPMRYISYVRGRSAAYFEFADPQRHIYPVFLTDMDEILRTIGITDAITPKATWESCKRGSNYGLRLAKEDS